MPCSIWISLLYFKRFVGNWTIMWGWSISFLIIDRTATTISIFLTQWLINIFTAVLLTGFQLWGWYITFDWIFWFVMLFMIKDFSGKGGSCTIFIIWDWFYWRLRLRILFCVRGCSFGIELHWSLNIFYWGFGSTVPVGLSLIEGSIAFAPLNEILPKSRIFQLLSQLFRLHEITLQLLHI